MNKEKLISILLPVKNEELFIKTSIESILAQTHKNFELIIIDDSSTDKTFTIAKKYELKNKKIKVLANPNIGKVSAFNYGYKKSKGELFIFFAGDDILPKNSLEQRARYITKGEVACGQLLTISDDQKFDGRKIPKFGKKGHISGGSIIFNKNLASKIFPIPESLPNEDTWTMLAIKYLSKPAINIPHIVIKYRIHKKNSHCRYMPFDEMNLFISERNKAYKLFLKEKKYLLTTQNIQELTYIVEAEDLRFTGNWLSVLVKYKLPISIKKTFILNSSNFFYRFKIFLSFL